MAKTKRITFEEWIEREGVRPLARRLGVDRFTVLNWKAKRCDPRVAVMRKIKRLTKGEIGYEQMIDRATPTNRSATGGET